MPGPGYSFLGIEERRNVEQVLGTWDLTRFAVRGDGSIPHRTPPGASTAS